jgi:hypothetical protein
LHGKHVMPKLAQLFNDPVVEILIGIQACH